MIRKGLFEWCLWSVCLRTMCRRARLVLLRVSILLPGLAAAQYAAAQIAALDYPHSHCMPGAVCACIDPSSTPPEDKGPCGLDEHVPNMGTPHGVTQAAELAQLAWSVYPVDPDGDDGPKPPEPNTSPPVGWRQVFDQRYDSGFHATVYQNDFGDTVLSYEGTARIQITSATGYRKLLRCERDIII